MKLDKEYFDSVEKLVKHKNNPDLNDFFETLYKLEHLVEDINHDILEKSPGVLKLEKQVQVLTKKLKDHKDEFARLTKTQKEYDAVYHCIDYLDIHLNYRK